MKYLVMECHPAYAVVLDEKGRFLKVPNLCYEVGQELSDVLLAEETMLLSPEGEALAEAEGEPLLEVREKVWSFRALRLLSAAAVFCVLLAAVWFFALAPVGTVRVTINPDVRLTVNRLDFVTGLEALNHDGGTLLQGYRSFGKKTEQVTDELADRAYEEGFLKDGGTITLTVSSGDRRWRHRTEARLQVSLDRHFAGRVRVDFAESPGPEATFGVTTAAEIPSQTAAVSETAARTKASETKASETKASETTPAALPSTASPVVTTAPADTVVTKAPAETTSGQEDDADDDGQDEDADDDDADDAGDN